MSTPTSRSPISFAQNVTNQLRDNARELSKETGIKSFCSALEGALTNVCRHLKDLGKETNNTSSEPRLVKLMDSLEKMCQWPPKPNISSRPSRFDRRRYPNLNRLLGERQVLKVAMREFASHQSAKEDRKSLLKLLKAFEKPQKDGRGPELSELRLTDTREQNDYQAYIRDLYACLSSHCFCARGIDHNGITANLRLNSCCTPGELPDSVNFSLFFLDHPHSHGADGTCQWQDAQICVRRNRRIKFGNEQVADNSVQSRKVVSMEAFCDIITNRHRAQLKLECLDNSLVLQNPGGLSRDFLPGPSSVSLARLLPELSRKMKMLLSYILAKAVWQYYDSDWMQGGWTKETIHFFERRVRVETIKGIFINEPFLSVRFGTIYQPRRVDDSFRSHPFPKILALGIMLLEIELGVQIEGHRSPECMGSGGKPTVNDDHLAAMDLFDKTEWEERETPGAFKEIIETCLTPDKFRPFVADVEGLRAALKTHIADRLHALYEIFTSEHPDKSHVRAIVFRFSGPSSSEAKGQTPCPESPLAIPLPTRLSRTPELQMRYCPSATPSVTKMHPLSSCHPMQSTVSQALHPLPDAIMSISSNITSEDWFKELDKLNSVLRPKVNEKDNRYQPVKIAILDTGISDDYADSVQDYKDFVSRDDEDYQDNTGHGTSAFRLIQKVYRLAEIYVGRVFEGSQATKETATLMAEAVRYAMNTWKVDIIVMPSGFKDDHKGLGEAVEEARNARVLIFAAASNYGNVVGITFPARLYLHWKLFCMFATDPTARAGASFNPSPLKKATYNFAILGDNIVLPNSQLLSGTSYATMIGAAVAGRILDFSRHKDNRERIRRIEKLKTVEGMSAVFKKMAKNGEDNHYHCMAPWKILPQVRGEGPTEKRLLEREYIAETISRALEDM